MTAEVKIRTLAIASATLQTYFGEASGIFRWFDRQLPPGYIPRGTCARLRRVSTAFDYAHETSTRRAVSRLNRPLFQIDVLDTDPERARSAAAAITDWLAEVDFSSGAQFASPPTTPKRHPNAVVNQRPGMEPSVSPIPVYVETLDVRIFNLEEE
jgi:hypothetical protein